MAISPARECAYKVLRRVESGRGFAVDLLQEGAVSELREIDRKLATELVMGVLRWRGELDFQIERLSGRKVDRLDPEVATIFRLGIYQIRFLEKVPKAAAVNEAVELAKAARKRSAAGLVNAVLRKCEPPAQRLTGRRFEELNSDSLEGVRRAIPDWLCARWAANFEEGNSPQESSATSVALKLAWASLQVPPTTLRVVGGESAAASVQEELARQGIRTHPGRFSPSALIVESGNVQASAAFREGRVVIQDEASQLVAELLAPEPGQAILDLCAAPGIKAAQLAAALRQGALVACDVSAARLRTLERLLLPAIPPEVRLDILRLDATRAMPLAASFDRILVDAPCSGTGTLARNPEIKARLLPKVIARLAELQRKILANACPLLAPSGRLVYATCSLEPEENEGVVEGVLGSTAGFRRPTPEELTREFPRLRKLFDATSYFRTRPDIHDMDGFFAAVLVRSET